MMATYRRIGDPPTTIAITVRWPASRQSEAARRLFGTPRHAPEIIRRVLEEAQNSGRLEAIAQEVERQPKG